MLSFCDFSPILTFPQGGRKTNSSFPLCGTGKGVLKEEILSISFNNNFIITHLWK
jgi:hypothetical protein